MMNPESDTHCSTRTAIIICSIMLVALAGFGAIAANAPHYTLSTGDIQVQEANAASLVKQAR